MNTTSPASKHTAAELGQKLYTFKSMANGDFLAQYNKPKEITVLAHTEAEARHAAMVSRWGKPLHPYTSPYRGRGLELISVTEPSAESLA